MDENEVVNMEWGSREVALVEYFIAMFALLTLAYVLVSDMSVIIKVVLSVMNLCSFGLVCWFGKDLER